MSLLSLVFLISVSSAQAQEAALDLTNTSLNSEFAAKYSASFFELYSETSFRPDYDSVTTDTRLRYKRPILTESLKAYFGISIERDLRENPKLAFISNAVSPQIGLLYQPLPYVTFWAEYRQRYQESQGQTYTEGEADPRAGFATGYFAGEGHSFFEAYGEAVMISRLSSSGVFSGYLRPFLRRRIGSAVYADAYAEFYGYSSPTADMGPSRTQGRLGGRLGVQAGAWQSSLLLYKPWNISSSAQTDTQPEALLVIGGIF